MNNIRTIYKFFMLLLILLGSSCEPITQEEKVLTEVTTIETPGIDSVMYSQYAQYADSSGFAKTLSTPITSGSYIPIWKTTKGFVAAPGNCNCEYSRVGSIVNVVCDLGVPNFGLGTNRATITVPEGLTVKRPYFVSGTFSSDHYRNSLDPNVGIVGKASANEVELQVNNSPSFLASAWCSFTYKTDAE